MSKILLLASVCCFSPISFAMVSESDSLSEPVTRLVKNESAKAIEIVEVQVQKATKKAEKWGKKLKKKNKK